MQFSISDNCVDKRGTMGVNRQQDLTSSCTVVLLGDARAGKTAMVNRLLTDKFSEVRLREREKKNQKLSGWCYINLLGAIKAL